MGDYYFVIEDGKVYWFEEFFGGGMCFNVFLSMYFIFLFFYKNF